MYVIKYKRMALFKSLWFVNQIVVLLAFFVLTIECNLDVSLYFNFMKRLKIYKVNNCEMNFWFSAKWSSQQYGVHRENTLFGQFERFNCNNKVVKSKILSVFGRSICWSADWRQTIQGNTRHYLITFLRVEIIDSNCNNYTRITNNCKTLFRTCKNKNVVNNISGTCSTQAVVWNTKCPWKWANLSTRFSIWKRQAQQRCWRLP